MDAEKIQLLWDQRQIERLLVNYCRGIDRCDTELLKSVYWPEAHEEHGLFNGNAWGFADFIVPMLRTMRVTMHSISNSLIDIDGDKATGETYVVAYHLADNPEGGGQTDLVVGGRYLDRFERRADEWRIAHRTFVLDWNQNLCATAQWDSGLYAELRLRGRQDRDDPSYAHFRNG